MHRHLRLLVFTISVGALSFGHAQTILLEENFNDGNLGVFTQISVLGDGQMWEARTFQDRMFAQMNGFDMGIQINEDWLISPALDMDVYEDELLSFLNASNFDGPDLAVLVSTDYDGTSDPGTANWTDISADVNWSPGSYEYVSSGELDISSFSGTGYVAFRYISSPALDGKLWQVDSVVVKASVLSSTDETASAERLISEPLVQNGQLTFAVLADRYGLNLAIYGMDGRRYGQQQRVPFASDVQIDVNQLVSGVYLLQVEVAGQVGTYRFVKP